MVQPDAAPCRKSASDRRGTSGATHYKCDAGGACNRGSMFTMKFPRPRPCGPAPFECGPRRCRACSAMSKRGLHARTHRGSERGEHRSSADLNRQYWPGRHPRRRVDPDRIYLYEGRPGTGKTTLALQFLMEGGRRASGASISRFGNPAGTDSSRGATAGRSMVSTFSNWCRPRHAGSRARVDGAPSGGNGAERNDPDRFSTRSGDSTRHAWWSTASPKCGCWPRARCAIGGRFWR